MNKSSTVIDLQATIPAERYIRDFRDAEKFLKLCRECRNFGRSWACPPFAHGWLPELRKYQWVTIFATKIVPSENGQPVSIARDLFRHERLRIEPQIRQLEKDTGGLAFAFAGECLYCPEGECARIRGEECKHPELVRPSLEAAGFDIGKTTAELFDLPLLWSSDGTAPEYFVLVCGLFHS